MKKKETMAWVWRIALCALLAAVVLVPQAVYATDTTETVTSKFSSLQDLVGSILSSIGAIITLWGIGEWGIAFQSQEGTMQASAFKRIAGGLVMAMASTILAAII